MHSGVLQKGIWLFMSIIGFQLYVISKNVNCLFFNSCLTEAKKKKITDFSEVSWILKTVSQFFSTFRTGGWMIAGLCCCSLGANMLQEVSDASSLWHRQTFTQSLHTQWVAPHILLVCHSAWGGRRAVWDEEQEVNLARGREVWNLLQHWPPSISKYFHTLIPWARAQ